jgi:hypothetical protein
MHPLTDNASSNMSAMRQKRLDTGMACLLNSNQIWERAKNDKLSCRQTFARMSTLLTFQGPITLR